MSVRKVGAKSTCSCTQLGHLTNLLKNKVNSQQNPILYEVWNPNMAEDVEKQMVRRLYRDSKVPRTCMGTKVAVVSGLAPGTRDDGCHRSFGEEPDQ